MMILDSGLLFGLPCRPRLAAPLKPGIHFCNSLVRRFFCNNNNNFNNINNVYIFIPPIGLVDLVVASVAEVTIKNN